MFPTKEMGMGRLPVALRVALGAGACGLAGAIFAPAMLLGAPATVQVNEGDFTPPKLLTEFNTFFPGRTVIHQGDKVRFIIQGFHTLVIPKKGADPPPLFVPTGQLNPPKNDPAGVPYWWVGQPAINFNPAAFGPSGGTVATGAKTISSGLINGDPAKFTVTFPKTGTFQVRCAIHPKMKGTIVVRPRTKSVPTAATLARRAQGEAGRPQRGRAEEPEEGPRQHVAGHDGPDRTRRRLPRDAGVLPEREHGSRGHDRAVPDGRAERVPHGHVRAQGLR